LIPTPLPRVTHHQFSHSAPHFPIGLTVRGVPRCSSSRRPPPHLARRAFLPATAATPGASWTTFGLQHSPNIQLRPYHRGKQRQLRWCSAFPNNFFFSFFCLVPPTWRDRERSQHTRRSVRSPCRPPHTGSHHDTTMGCGDEPFSGSEEIHRAILYGEVLQQQPND